MSLSTLKATVANELSPVESVESVAEYAADMHSPVIPGDSWNIFIAK